VVDKLSEEATRTLSVDHLRVSDRSLLVSAAWDILSEWPKSFIDFANQSGISVTHFYGARSLQPAWMNKTIVDHLALQNRNVTDSVVEQAIASWKMKHGIMPTKTQLRHLLRWQGERGLDRFYSTRGVATAAESKEFFGTALCRMQTLRRQPRSFRHCLFDMGVLVYCIKRHCSIDVACVLTFNQLLNEISAFNSQVAASDPMSPIISELCKCMSTIPVENIFGVGSSHACPRQVKKRFVSLMINLDKRLERDVAIFKCSDS
jgi:hypothetical protein